MEWSPPVIWSVLGLALIALEAVTPGLVIVFFGIGALMTALAALYFDMDASRQFIVFACSSLVSLALLRGWLRKLFQGRAREDEVQVAGMESLIGATGVVSEAIPQGGTGRVKLRGTFYSATSSQELAVGEAVRVEADPRGDHSELVVAKNHNPGG